MIMLSLPFGLIGGLWAVYLAGYNMSVAVAVGFIALGGIAVETAVVMLLYIDMQVRQSPPKTRDELRDAVIAGAVMRVRPKLMTVGVITAGLLPIFFTDGLGSRCDAPHCASYGWGNGVDDLAHPGRHPGRLLPLGGPSVPAIESGQTESRHPAHCRTAGGRIAK